MLKRSTALSAVLFWTAASIVLPASAEDTVPVSTVEAETLVEAAPTVAVAIEHIAVTVEGKSLDVRARGLGTDAAEFDASPIFEHLRSRFEARESILGYWRFQDGAVMGLDFSDGKVRANGAVLGKLPDFPTRDVADTWLSPNAISVLTGTKVSFDEATGWNFELDERLKPQFDLDLWVNESPVTVRAGLEPRTIGPVLLVPLRAVTDALGHTLVEDKAAGTVTVTRIQDSAVIELELATGLVSINGVPSGVTPNIAYAEPNSLVLPFSAIETLTGSHVELVPGTNRVDVKLDDRLSSLALPGERVDEEAENTPFTPEKLDFQLSDRGPLKFDFYSRVEGFNTVATYETVGGLDPAVGLAPRWVSLDVQSLSGWRGTVGDYSGQFREFNGTDANRIRGVAYRSRLTDGTVMAIAAGLPVSGATPTENGASKPEFGGFAAGVRFIKPDARTEYGVAASVSPDGDSSRIVAGGRKDLLIAREGPTGLEGVYVSGDVGVFTGQGRDGLDARGRVEARYRVSERVSVQGTATYDGAKFLGGSRGADTGLSSGSVGVPGARSGATLAADWHAKQNWGVLRNVSGGIRTSVTHVGGTSEATTVSTNGAVSVRIGEGGPHVSLDAGMSEFSQNGDSETSNTFAARAFQNYDWGAVTAAYTQSNTEDGRSERFVATTSLPSWKRNLGKGASAAVGPTASFVWTPQTTEARLGATASADSGQVLGERLRLNGQFTTLASVDPEKESSNVYANVGATYRLFDKIGLQSTYSTDFGGRSDISIALRGSILFNEPRKHTEPKDGAGVLKGRVFFDKNRDGIRQPDEPGIPGVRLGVTGTRLALNVDNQGSYTIQNMKTGLYTLNIDRRSLPLGMLIAEGEDPRATIGDGRVTTLDIPVMASGQVRGSVFVDANDNGALDKGEQRLEGQWVRLTPVLGGDPVSIQSASFGQYGFESIAPGDYMLRVNIGGRKVNVPVTLTDENLFAEENIPIPTSAMLGGAMESDGVFGTP